MTAPAMVQPAPVHFAGPLVCFFYNPFSADVARRVMARLVASHRAEPRSIHLVYVNVRSMAEAAGWFENVAPFRCVSSGKHHLIFHASV